MKTLFLIRHAKSSWKDASLADHDRPLNKRGFRDAPIMAKWLAMRKNVPDAIFSSTALRARTTAKYFAETWELAEDKFHLEPNIYEASVSTLIRIISVCPASLNTICLFGHNPSFTLLANQFDGMYIANVPTCGIVEIELDIDQWSDIHPSKGRIKEFYYPKMFNL